MQMSTTAEINSDISFLLLLYFKITKTTHCLCCICCKKEKTEKLFISYFRFKCSFSTKKAGKRKTKNKTRHCCNNRPHREKLKLQFKYMYVCTHVRLYENYLFIFFIDICIVVVVAVVALVAVVYHYYCFVTNICI